MVLESNLSGSKSLSESITSLCKTCQTDKHGLQLILPQKNENKIIEIWSNWQQISVTGKGKMELSGVPWFIQHALFSFNSIPSLNRPIFLHEPSLSLSLGFWSYFLHARTYFRFNQLKQEFSIEHTIFLCQCYVGTGFQEMSSKWYCTCTCRISGTVLVLLSLVSWGKIFEEFAFVAL